MNDKKKKNLNAALTSVIGIVIVAACLIVFNLIISPMNLRFDCTENRLYTLSDGTRKVLDGLERPVSIRFYYSKDASEMPVFLKAYAGRVADLLDEYRRHGNGRLEIKQLNPKPDSNEEDSAKLDGVTGQQVNPLGDGDPVYLGLAIACGSQTMALPFLNPEQEPLLEYEITRAITQVQTSKKPRLGLMSSLQVMGGIDNPQLMMMGQGGMKPAWTFVKELQRSFTVTKVETTAETISPDLDLLLIHHPKALSEATLFAIDQYLLQGGRLAVFVDPLSMVDLQEQQQRQYAVPEGSDLAPLFKAWGIGYAPDKIIIDRTLAFHSQTRSGTPEVMPTVLALTEGELSRDDPVTSPLSSMFMLCTGFFTGTPAEGLKQSVLISSTADSAVQESYTAQRSGRDILKDFKADDTVKAIALRLTGTFTTAFPDGRPAKPDAAEKPDAAAALAQSAREGAVLLIADADFIYDAFCVQRTNFLGQEVVQSFNDNLNFVMNAVENLCGSSELFQIRSRAVDNRPFERVRDIQAEAEKRYQAQIQGLEDELRNAQREIGELQRTRMQNDRELLKQFRQKEAEARIELKKVRKQLRQDIDRLENTLIAINIGLTPLLVVIGGLVAAAIRRRRAG